MSIRAWKDVLYPGRQQDKYGRWFTITRQSTLAAARNCKRMIGRGLRVPCVWEHQPGADPVELSHGDTIANEVKNSFGEIRDARVDAKGVLWLEHEIYDQADADKLKKIRAQVSPKLMQGFEDSKGHEYRGAVVAHVAATQRPCQYWQKPFELSQGQSLLLSYAEPDMAKDKEGKPEVEEEVPTPEPAEEPAPETEGVGDSDNAEMQDLKAVVEALREKGFNIPDEVADWKHLVIAIKAGSGCKADDDLDLNPNAGAPTTQQAAAPPMMMSDARTLERSRKTQRKGMIADAKGLFATGRITRQERIDLERKINAVELSFYDDGELTPNRLVERIAALGENKPWSAWKPTAAHGEAIELSNTVTEEHPEQMTRGSPSKEQDALIEETRQMAKSRSGSTPSK